MAAHLLASRLSGYLRSSAIVIPRLALAEVEAGTRVFVELAETVFHVVGLGALTRLDLALVANTPLVVALENELVGLDLVAPG
jgi:hypothetical protein